MMTNNNNTYDSCHNNTILNTQISIIAHYVITTNKCYSYLPVRGIIVCASGNF